MFHRSTTEKKLKRIRKERNWRGFQREKKINTDQGEEREVKRDHTHNGKEYVYYVYYYKSDSGDKIPIL